MHNLDKIIAKINADACGQIEQIRRETEEKLRQIGAETEQTIIAVETEAKDRTAGEKAAILSRAEASASMKSREILLAEKADLLDTVYKRAEEALLALPAEQYVDFVSRLAADAVIERVETVRFMQKEYADEAFDGEIGSGYRILLSAADRDTYGKLILDRADKRVRRALNDPPALRLDAEGADIPGGVLVRYGDTQTSCSVPVLLAGMREKLDPAVVKILFGSTASAGADV